MYLTYFFENINEVPLKLQGNSEMQGGHPRSQLQARSVQAEYRQEAVCSFPTAGQGDFKINAIYICVCVCNYLLL